MTDDLASYSVFNEEANKLESQIESMSSKEEFSPSDIVQIYYLTMNTNSLGTIMLEKNNIDDSIVKKIHHVQNLISEKFNSILHPKILQYLSSSISNLTATLQSNSSLDKSRDDVESDAKMFETLRELMSTKEFVEQYGRGISD